MPPSNQSAVGAAAVRQAYDAVFKAIKLDLKFTVAEVVQVAPDWAFARTNFCRHAHSQRDRWEKR
jgi:ketosteroid isomerase-like protein